VRTRIAADLHDDIGANLSLIALSSEVARRDAEEVPQLADRLSSIAGISRDLIDSMSDIVWAVNPNKDRAGDLSQRMRLFASNILSRPERRVRFQAELDREDHKLDANLRREVLMVFKEAVNNAARHSQCTQVDIGFKVGSGWLTLSVSDNGKGFDEDHPGDGNGLANMGKRAGNLGGELQVTSRSGEGATITLRIPITR